MLNKLKNTYAESKSESIYFEEVVKIIQELFKNPNKLKTFVDGPADGKCATTILRTHIRNNIV